MLRSLVFNGCLCKVKVIVSGIPSLIKTSVRFVQHYFGKMQDVGCRDGISVQLVFLWAGLNVDFLNSPDPFKHGRMTITQKNLDGVGSQV